MLLKQQHDRLLYSKCFLKQRLGHGSWTFIEFKSIFRLKSNSKRSNTCQYRRRHIFDENIEIIMKRLLQWTLNSRQRLPDSWICLEQFVLFAAYVTWDKHKKSLWFRDTTSEIPLAWYLFKWVQTSPIKQKKILKFDSLFTTYCVTK